MRHLLHRRPSPALLVAIVAVVLASAGSAVAARLITSKQIKDGTIQLKDLSGKARNALKSGRGPQGPPGQAGAPGPPGTNGQPGTAGTALAYARVNSNGTVDAANSKAVTGGNLIQKFTGGYCFGGFGFTPKSVVATPESPGGNFDAEVGLGAGPSACPAATQVRVFVRDSAGALADKAFFMLLN